MNLENFIYLILKMKFLKGKNILINQIIKFKKVINIFFLVVFLI